MQATPMTAVSWWCWPGWQPPPQDAWSLQVLASPRLKLQLEVVVFHGTAGATGIWRWTWHRQGRTECQGASAAATRQQQKRQAHRVGRLNRNTDRNSRLRLAEFDSAQQRIGLKRLEVVYGIMETLLLWSSTILETCPCPQETNSQRLVTLAARNFLCWSIHLPPISSWLSRLFLW